MPWADEHGIRARLARNDNAIFHSCTLPRLAKCDVDTFD